MKRYSIQNCLYYSIKKFSRIENRPESFLFSLIGLKRKSIGYHVEKEFISNLKVIYLVVDKKKIIIFFSEKQIRGRRNKKLFKTTSYQFYCMNRKIFNLKYFSAVHGVLETRVWKHPNVDPFEEIKGDRRLFFFRCYSRHRSRRLNKFFFSNRWQKRQQKS